MPRGSSAPRRTTGSNTGHGTGPPRPDRHRIAILALDQVIAFDLGVPVQVFGSAQDRDGHELYKIRTCTPTGQQVRSAAGFWMQPAHGPEILADAQTVIVPGVHARSPVIHGRLTDAEAAALALIRPGTRIMSICTGAFVLASAGLLDGRAATTHWAHTERFSARFPAVKLDPDVLFIDDGEVLTSAGVAAGIDLCLHVVRRDHGSEVANRAARRCVVPAWRDGGQAQFIQRPLPQSLESSTGPARAWALDRLGQQLDLAVLAGQARMSVRTFTRRFRDETGVSPTAWLTKQRLELARQLLETTDLPVETVARRAGFGTAVSLRQHLRAALGVAPLAYRKTFHAQR
jgi:transcriptional regulator GlxA family with amidase domain